MARSPLDLANVQVPVRAASPDGVSRAGEMTTLYGLVASGAVDPAGPGRSPDYNLFRPLGREGFNQVLVDAKIAGAYDHSTTLPYVSANFRAMVATRDKYLALASDESQVDFGDYSALALMTVDLTTQVLNWLSSMRSFVDHTTKSVGDVHGKSSKALDLFKSALSLEFDDCWPYRFLSKLRNLAQHERLPIESTGVRKRWHPTSGEEKVELTYAFDRDALLTSQGTWGKLREELAAQEPLIDVITVVGDCMESLARLNQVASGLLFPDIGPALARLHDLETAFAGVPGLPGVGQFVEGAPGQLMNANITPLDFTALHRVADSLRPVDVDPGAT